MLLLVLLPDISWSMSEHEDEYGEFDLKGWCSASKITESGLKKIEANAVTDLDTLLLFRDQDIDLLKLSAGDALRFRVAVQKLRVLSDTPPGLVGDGKGDKADLKSGKGDKPDLKSSDRLYTSEEVQRLLAGKEAVASGASGVTGVFSSEEKAVAVPVQKDTLSALLGKSTSTIEEVRTLMRDLLNLDDTPLNAKGERALLPIHFLSCIRGTQDKDEVIHSGHGLNLVLQTTKRG